MSNVRWLLCDVQMAKLPGGPKIESYRNYCRAILAENHLAIETSTLDVAQQIKDFCRAAAAAKSEVELNPEDDFQNWNFNGLE